MLTDKELIEAQQKDIDMLVALVRAKNKELEELKNSGSFGTDFKFGAPYYRITSTEIVCYRLFRIEWFSNYTKPLLDLRFARVYTLDLNTMQVDDVNYGGSYLLKTCISHEQLLGKLNARKQKAFNKGDTALETKWANTIKTVIATTNRLAKFFELKEC